MDEVKIKEIFDQCDTDKSGYIEHTEMNIKAVLIKSGFSEQKASLLSKASMRSLLVANPTRHPKTSLVVLGKANLAIEIQCSGNTVKYIFTGIASEFD